MANDKENGVKKKQVGTRKENERASRLGTVVVVAALVLMVARSNAPAAEVAELGSLEFPNSGAAIAQSAFTKGMLLLHSFEYDDAREAFEAARTLDPSFALAAWGEAMTHNHPLWRGQDFEAARAVLAELGETPEVRLAAAPTEREKGYLRAVEMLYGEGDKIDRDRRYEQEMSELSARYPDDLEAKSLYALAILGTAQGVRDFRVYMRAGAVAEEVFAANPRHPGAAHYLIHSYDDPVHAPLGLRAARVYADIAPAASHAQHMISHIFVALGHWEESIAANIKSYEVSAERVANRQLGVDERNYHSLHWLQYSLLQLGRFAEADATLEQMREMAGESRSARALWYFAAMRAGRIVESESHAAPPPSLGGGEWFSVEVLDLFGTGFAAARRGAADELSESSSALRERIRQTSAADFDAGDPYTVVNERDVAKAEVLALELEALELRSSGKLVEAVELLTRAAELEAVQPLEFGPPEIVKPSHELLGELLIEQGRFTEAIELFDQALLRAPRRRLSLEGKARAEAGTQATDDARAR